MLVTFELLLMTCRYIIIFKYVFLNKNDIINIYNLIFYTVAKMTIVLKKQLDNESLNLGMFSYLWMTRYQLNDILCITLFYRSSMVLIIIVLLLKRNKHIHLCFFIQQVLFENTDLYIMFNKISNGDLSYFISLGKPFVITTKWICINPTTPVFRW